MAAVGAAVLALAVVALLVRRGPSGAGRTNPAPSGSAGPAAAAADSAAAAPRAAAETAKACTARTGPTPMPAAAGAVSSPATAPGSAPSPVRTGLRRYAQTWANVRGERTLSAPAVGRLNPGDAVTVDSLVRGWYRVLVDGRTLGYVHRSTLDVSRPE